MDYVSFCRAVEPAHGGRDIDNQERELEKAWRVGSTDGDDAVDPGWRSSAPAGRHSRMPLSEGYGIDGNGEGEDDLLPVNNLNSVQGGLFSFALKVRTLLHMGYNS